MIWKKRKNLIPFVNLDKTNTHSNLWKRLQYIDKINNYRKKIYICLRNSRPPTNKYLELVKTIQNNGYVLNYKNNIIIFIQKHPLTGLPKIHKPDILLRQLISFKLIHVYIFKNNSKNTKNKLQYKLYIIRIVIYNNTRINTRYIYNDIYLLFL